MMEPSTDPDDGITKLIERLTIQFGRLPTEDEIYNFIFGDQATRERIWNTSK